MLRAATVFLIASVSVMPALSQTSAEAEKALRKSEQKAREADRRLMRLVYDPLEAFQKDAKAGCESEHLRTAGRLAANVADRVNSDEQFKFDTRFAAGVGLADVADTAKKHGCHKMARDFYDVIIKVYTGIGYAALRQRAQIGIDDLRAKTR